MLYVCARGVVDVVFFVCIVTRGAVGDHVWEVGVIHHADVVCLCVVCILCQFSMLYSALLAGRGCQRRPYGRGIPQSWSHDCLVGSYETLLLSTPSCCCDCFYHL